MIIITGATGALGAIAVDHLLGRMPAREIVVVARDVSRAERYAERGIEVRYGDYADPASLPSAFAGGDQLLLVSSSDPRADAVALHRAAIEAAVEVGVGRILYTSHQGAAPDTPFGPGRDHAATEVMLAESGVAWTALRNGFYAHSLEWLMGSWRETGMVTVPADGRVSWTAREDLAEAAATILASEGAYDGPTTLTAGAAPTFEEVAALLSEITGRRVGCQIVDPQEWIEAQISAGQPEAMARFTLPVYEAAAQGFFAGTDPLLGTLLGRAPQTVGDVLGRVASDQM